jgi:hypothetical protein
LFIDTAILTLYYRFGAVSDYSPITQEVAGSLNMSVSIGQIDQTVTGLTPVTSVLFLIAKNIANLVKRGCFGGISEIPLLPLRG